MSGGTLGIDEGYGGITKKWWPKIKGRPIVIGGSSEGTTSYTEFVINTATETI